MGEVRERMGRVSISVEEAHEYQLKAEGQAESEAEAAKNGPGQVIRAGFNDQSEPRPVLNDPVQGMRGTPTQHGTSGDNGTEPASPEATQEETYDRPDQPAYTVREESPPAVTPATVTDADPAGAEPVDTDPDGIQPSGGPVVVRVKETGDAADDRYRLEDIVKLFIEFPGPDEAVLEIETGERIVRLDMPFSVDSSTQLTRRLHELLGTGTVRMSTA
jgi:hypothetical protein